MKPFDLEAAKRGEPFGYQFHNGSCKLRAFIGVRSNGEIVYEHPRDGSLDSTSATNLRMLPRKTARWVNIYRRSDGTLRLSNTGPHDAEEDATFFNSASGDPKVGTARVEWEE